MSYREAPAPCTDEVSVRQEDCWILMTTQVSEDLGGEHASSTDQSVETMSLPGAEGQMQKVSYEWAIMLCDCDFSLIDQTQVVAWKGLIHATPEGFLSLLWRSVVNDDSRSVMPCYTDIAELTLSFEDISRLSDYQVVVSLYFL